MSWKRELSDSITTAEQLCSFLGLPKSSVADYRKLIDKFPMQITPYYLSLIDKNDSADPIKAMCIPSFEELDLSGSFDTSGEESNTREVGVQHKYRRTALILSTNVCAMYCRHCFRKRLVGLTDSELLEQFSTAVSYVKSHPEINNVLISGGDSLMNPNYIIKRYLDEFCALDSLDFIRFGTRVPVTFPSRITKDRELPEIFSEYAAKKTICIVTQFNHPREITEETAAAVRCFTERGITVRNQTVLLKGVNDSPKTLTELFCGLSRINVIPYYLFQCRPVTGVKTRFQVPLREAVKIVDQAKRKMNGISKSFRYVMSHPHGKIEILGALDDEQMLFKFHRSKDPENNARIFIQQIGSTETWLDEDLCAE